MGSPMMTLDIAQEVPEATSQDLRDAFNHLATYYLGMSGDEFLRRLDADELPNEAERIEKVLRRIDFVRPGWTKANQ